MDAAHLAVIFSATSSRSGTAVDRLTHVGAVVRSSGHRVSTYDKLLKIEELFPVTPTPIDVGDLREFVAAEEVDRLLAARNDVQLVSEEVATALVTAISHLRPTMPPVIDWLRALEGFSGLTAIWLKRQYPIRLQPARRHSELLPRPHRATLCPFGPPQCKCQLRDVAR